MRIIDITVPLRPGMVVWPGDAPFTLEATSDMTRGDLCNTSRVAMSIHLGTHVDAPRHFIAGGASIAQIDPAVFIGPCRVIALEDRDAIDAEALEPHDLAGVARILFKTTNSRLLAEPRFHENYVALTADGARYLAAIDSLRLVGMDYFSISRFGEENTKAVHTTLLSRSIIALEGVDLSRVAPGDYELIALPLRLEDSDGSPVRAVLIDRAG